jgi:CYTH domain-containing protein
MEDEGEEFKLQARVTTEVTGNIQYYNFGLLINPLFNETIINDKAGCFISILLC